MPWKLIAFVIALVLITFFAGFNLDNKCTISFVFKTVENAPVFLCLMIAFLAGMVVMIPFSIKSNLKKKNNKNDKSLVIQESNSKKTEKEKKAFFKTAQNTKKSKDNSSGDEVIQMGTPSDSEKSANSLSVNVDKTESSSEAQTE